MLIHQQIPNFALIILCALGKGGGKDNEDNVSGKKAMFDSLNSCYLILQMNVYPVTKMPIYSVELNCQSSRCNTCNDQWHSHTVG